METEGFLEMSLFTVLRDWWKKLLVVGLVAATILLFLGQHLYLALLFSDLFNWAVVCEVARFRSYEKAHRREEN